MVATSSIRSSNATSTTFCEQYDEKYAATYGRYRLERIQQIGERFSTCGDYLQGVAQIHCTNPECGHDYFQIACDQEQSTTTVRRIRRTDA